jgi:hypothetical protein
VRYSYLEGIGCGGSRYNYVSPDFYHLVPWEGPGFKPIGYGYESIAANLTAMARLESSAAAGLSKAEARAKRRDVLAEIDRQGILATPANSFINELVVEAARISILNDGAWVDIAYHPKPHTKVNRGRDEVAAGDLH